MREVGWKLKFTGFALDGDSPLLVNITLDVLEVQQSQTRVEQG